MTGPPNLPRFPLVAAPTPVQRAARLERALGMPGLYVKRDDLTGLAVAGNKARKLEFIVADAMNRGADALVTGGGPASNHCHATAVAARVAGLGCVLLYYGHPPSDEPLGLGLARSFGAEVRFTGDPRRDSVDGGLAAVAKELRDAGRRPYLVPRGGATPLGAAAYGLAAWELARQLEDLGVRPATVVVAAGSGGTQAGLVAGTVSAGRPWHVVGASVSRPVDECRARVLRLAQDVAELCEWPTAGPADVDVRDAIGPGYGEPSTAGEKAARLAADHEGLLLDPVFTAKAMAQVSEMASAGAAGPIVFWHTGGLLAAISAATQGSHARQHVQV
ncbi:MAG TPA: pyridoxal-phosphate dependent enzyme [Jiangellaceae bacterium]|nr:pyridoxal-phosphate dependent enzyme [Jiangellaceae bacterium]